MANVLWLGDSISELNATGAPLPWQVGRILSHWTEPTQYRNASGDEYSPSMATTGTPTSLEEAGFGGRAVDLAVGQHAATEASGEGVSVLWTRRPGGGVLEVAWGTDLLGSIDTSGSERSCRTTTFRRAPAVLPEEITVTCGAGTARLEGVYVHGANLDAGVRVWPAVRSGNASRQFVAHAGWGLDALDSLRPDLVVIATGTNDDDYPSELAQLVEAIRALDPEVDVAIWLPPITIQFTVERAAAGRQVAAAEGWAVIDAAAVLGSLPTIDGVHPTSVTTAMSAGHAASVLAGDTAGGAAMLVAQVVSALSGGQTWQPGVGPISLESMLGVTLLSGRVAPNDSGHAWAFLPPELARPLLDLPGVSLSFGPGGDVPIDAHLSRVGPGELAVNAGRGQFDAGRVLVGEGDEPDTPSSAAVLYARSGDVGTELVAKFPDGTSRVVAGPAVAARPGLCAPVPCAIAPHRRAGSDVLLELDAVVWLPFPVLAAPAAVTHVWIDLANPASGASATAAIVGSGPDGRPGAVSASTAVGAIDLSGDGMRGAALTEPRVVAAGERWWVAVHVTGSGNDPVAKGGEDLEGWPTFQVGTAPVVPGPGASCGGLRLTDQLAIPDRPGAVLTALAGSVPVVYVSLQAP